MKRLLLCSAIAVSLVGCAGANYRPVIDDAGVDPLMLMSDLSACQHFATQRANAAQGAAVGALLGGVLAAVLSKGTGIGSHDRNVVVGQSAVLGAVAGGANSEVGQREIIKNCMAGRGYRVLQ